MTFVVRKFKEHTVMYLYVHFWRHELKLKIVRCLGCEGSESGVVKQTENSLSPLFFGFVPQVALNVRPLTSLINAG